MSQLTVACIQMRSGTDVPANVEVASRLVREAAAAGATFVATPEMTSLLDRRPGKLLEQARAEEDDIALPAFRALAAELGITLLVGSLAVRVLPEQCANRSFLLDPAGRIRARYDKVHLFDVDLGPGQVYRESKRFVAGERSCLVALDGWRLGMSVCYDLRFPEFYRDLARRGADLLVVPSAFTVPTGEAHWHVLLRARAIETGCFVLAPAQHGLHEDGSETYGHSLVVDPWGRVIAERPADPGVLLATLDLDEVGRCRARLPSLRHDRPWTAEDC
jgi:predicted amidohydrolase